MTAAKFSNEMFSMVGSEKLDAHLHEPILDNPQAEKAILQRRIEKMMAEGVPLEQILAAYG